MYNTSAITLHYSYGQSARTFDPSNIPNPHKCIVFSSHDTKTELKAFYTPISRDTTLDDSTEIDSVHYKKKKKKRKKRKKGKKKGEKNIKKRKKKEKEENPQKKGKDDQRKKKKKSIINPQKKRKPQKIQKKLKMKNEEKKG